MNSLRELLKDREKTEKEKIVLQKKEIIQETPETDIFPVLGTYDLSIPEEFAMDFAVKITKKFRLLFDNNGQKGSVILVFEDGHRFSGSSKTFSSDYFFTGRMPASYLHIQDKIITLYKQHNLVLKELHETIQRYVTKKDLALYDDLQQILADSWLLDNPESVTKSETEPVSKIITKET